MSNPNLLLVILSKLGHCEVLGKVLVALKEDHPRHSVHLGYRSEDIQRVLQVKYKVMYAMDAVDRMIAELVNLKLIHRVSTSDAHRPYFDLSQTGQDWATAILGAAKVKDERFVPYVRTKRLETSTP